MSSIAEELSDESVTWRLVLRGAFVVWTDGSLGLFPLVDFLLELVDERADTMGIFVYDLGRESTTGPDPEAAKPYVDLPRTPKPLRNDDFLGDQIVQWARRKRAFKFVFKRKIYLPAQNAPSQDDMFSRLVYLQAEDEVINLGRLGFADYRALAQTFDTVFVEDVPLLRAGMMDATRRFVTLIDALYAAGLRVPPAVAAPSASLSPGGGATRSRRARSVASDSISSA